MTLDVWKEVSGVESMRRCWCRSGHSSDCTILAIIVFLGRPDPPRQYIPSVLIHCCQHRATTYRSDRGGGRYNRHSRRGLAGSTRIDPLQQDCYLALGALQHRLTMDSELSGGLAAGSGRRISNKQTIDVLQRQSFTPGVQSYVSL
ncbi:hypothetical protein TNCV_370941 [Trichonephila clavipes]|nr:hypothetical protein TNCV_370941 [Trichonephila clavipes]